MARERPLVSNHQQVLQLLKSARSPMTAYEILDAVRKKGITAPPTVYRALARLQEDGMVHRLESINAYVALLGRATSPRPAGIYDMQRVRQCR